MEQTPDEARVWDGAGLISRRMLRKLVLSEAEGMALSEDPTIFQYDEIYDDFSSNCANMKEAQAKFRNEPKKVVF